MVSVAEIKTMAAPPAPSPVKMVATAQELRRLLALTRTEAIREPDVMVEEVVAEGTAQAKAEGCEVAQAVKITPLHRVATVHRAILFL